MTLSDLQRLLTNLHPEDRTWLDGHVAEGLINEILSADTKRTSNLAAIPLPVDLLKMRALSQGLVVLDSEFSDLPAMRFSSHVSQLLETEINLLAAGDGHD
ncbi:MAG: hypothetical protein RPR28_10095 [Cycloclasticus sp.]|jgi:hypothetical protein